MQGEVKISLESFLQLQSDAVEGRNLANSIKTQSEIFVKEVTILLNLLYKERDIVDILNTFNKESITGHVHIDVDNQHVMMQLKNVEEIKV